MKNKHLLGAFTVIMATTTMVAQDRDELLSDAMRTAPGKERAERLVKIAADELANGRTRYAIEFAMLGSAEADRHDLDAEVAKAQVELARAHMAKDDLVNAVKACMQVTRLEGAQRSADRDHAELLMAGYYLDEGFHQLALEHLQRIGDANALDKDDHFRFRWLETKALAEIKPPAEAARQCDRMLSSMDANTDPRARMELLSLRASSETKAGHLQEAFDSEQLVYNLGQTLQLGPESGVAKNNMGELLQRLGRTEEAIAAFEDALVLLRDQPVLRSRTVVNIAHTHARNGDVNAGINVLDKAIRNANKQGEGDILPRLLLASATLKVNTDNPTAALEAAHAALAAAEKSANISDQALSCDMLALLHEHNGHFSEAAVFRTKAKGLHEQLIVDQDQARYAHEALLIKAQRAEMEQLELSNDDKNKEARMQQLALTVENSEKQLALLVYEKQLNAAAHREAILAKDQAHIELDLARAALEAERQARQINELDSDRMLQTMSVARLEAEQRQREKHVELMEERAQLMEAQSRTYASESKRSRDIKRFSVGIALGSMVVAALLLAAWLNARRKKRTIWLQNQQIKGINEALAEKDQSLQSSLRYARTIQSAIVPSESGLKSILPNSFLFYRPMDKVSGDMPYVKQVGDTVYLAAIDCTGHGVPAAMMTFIAYYGLNELIGNNADARCDELLDELHLHVKKAMDAREGTGLYNDGMDIGLCKIDLRKGRISFAGAQLSMFLVRAGKLMRIKGDVLPLGDDHFTRDQGYREETIDLQSGDSIYLFSDGIIHQFGGADGRKKLSMKRLGEMLMNSSGIELEEMKKRTEDLFLTWKGDTPQTDDILMIGMRYAA